nr:reverse transcriptase domain-containing protein [Tanacetum cinerariifolium]
MQTRSSSRLAPTEGYEDAIVVPAIAADNFELKHGLLTLVQNKQFFGHDKEDPHAHVQNKQFFGHRLSSCFFHFPSKVQPGFGPRKNHLDRFLLGMILFRNSLINSFLRLKTTSLRNEITNFQQRFDESFSEAWDRFKDLLRACPHHGFLELHQLDTFYNALNSKDQDSLNSATGGNFLDKMPHECLTIIESKSKVCYSRDKPVVAKVSTNASTSGVSPDVTELKDMVKALLLDKNGQNQAPAPMKAVEESYVTCGGAHSYRNCPATDGNNYRDNIQEFVSQAFVVNYNQGNTSYRPLMMSNQIRPPGFPPISNNQNVQRNNQNHFIPNHNQGNNFNQGPVYQPPGFQPPAYQAPAYQAPAPQTQGVSKEDFLAYVKANDAVMKNMQTQGTLPSNTIANPKSDLKAITTRSGVSYDGLEATKDTVNPTNNGNTEDVQPQAVQSESSVSTSKPVTSPISELAIALVIMVECLTLANPGASINLMPFSVWKRLSLPDLTPTYMTLELVDRSISRSVGVAEDVYVKAITFNLDQTSRYSANYSDMTVKRIDVIDMACKEYSHEVMGFSDTISSGNPTPFYDPIESATSLTLTPFENSDFLLKEGDILLLEVFLNDDPSLPPSNQRNNQPEVRKELKICEAKSDKSSVDEPPMVELKEINESFPLETPNLVSTRGNQSTPWFADFANDHSGNFIVKGMSSQQKRKFFKDVRHYFWDDPICLKSALIKSSEGVYLARKPLKSLRLATMDQQETSGQVEVSNRSLKRILERAVGENRASWSDKLDDALWEFRTTYKTLIGCTSCKLVYGKACHLPVELEHKAYGAVKHANFDLKTAGDHRKVQINELNKLRDQAYENSLIYKEKTKRLHDSKIKNRVFNISERVLLFNSRLKIFSGKLKSRWSGPFTISQVYPYGTVKLSQPDMPNFKVNGHRLKHYFGEDIPKLMQKDFVLQSSVPQLH